MISGVYINLPVKNVAATRAFFEGLGFAINEQFSGPTAVSVILGPTSAAMLLDEAFFKTFTPRPVSFGHGSTEVLIALQLESREAIDGLMEKALAQGATEPRPVQDLGFMYSRALSDLDGHIWEPFVMSGEPPKE